MMKKSLFQNISKSSTELTISVIVPVYNDVKNLQNCLQALQCSSVQPEIIIVDDASTDETVEFLRHSNLQNYRMLQNSGPAAARNFGAQYAQTEILLFIDADVQVHFDTIEKILSYFNQYPQVQAIIGSYDDEPSEPDFISQYKNLSHHIVHQTSKREAKTFWGACGAIHRNIFNELKGFDQNYNRPCIEDIELGYRLIAAGYTIHLVRDVLIKHAKKWTFSNLIRTDIFDRAIPWTHLLKKYKNKHNDLNISTTQKLSALFTLFFITSVIAGLYYSIFLIPALCFLILIVALNFSYYKFFVHKRSWLFAVRVLPYHILYYFYSTIGYFIAQVKSK